MILVSQLSQCWNFRNAGRGFWVVGTYSARIRNRGLTNTVSNKGCSSSSDISEEGIEETRKFDCKIKLNTLIGCVFIDQFHVIFPDKVEWCGPRTNLKIAKVKLSPRSHDEPGWDMGRATETIINWKPHVGPCSVCAVSPFGTLSLQVNCYMQTTTLATIQ